MSLFMVNPKTLIGQLAYYFPYYVGLVIIPMIARVVIERAVGIRPELFEETIHAILDGHLSYEAAFQTIVLSVLYFPLFEELVFRGIPFIFFGLPGLILGSAVWVVMHPAWQLQYLAEYPLSTRLVFTLTSSAYYTANAIFYSMMWLNGAGLAAIIYHILHNGWLVLADLIKEIELPAPWKKYRFVRQNPVAKRLSVKQQEEVGEETLPFKFVARKARRSLADEVEEAKEFMFVQRKA